MVLLSVTVYSLSAGHSPGAELTTDLEIGIPLAFAIIGLLSISILCIISNFGLRKKLRAAEGRANPPIDANRPNNLNNEEAPLIP